MTEPNLSGGQAEALFDAYLAHCHTLHAEAEAWAAMVPETLRGRLNGIAIDRELLEDLPRLPGWMAAHLNGTRPAVFRNPDGSETEMLEWPFSRHFLPRQRGAVLVSADRITAYARSRRPSSPASAKSTSSMMKIRRPTD